MISFRRAWSLGLGLLAALPALAEPIEDNSFLLEEAYNQEAGVVQFIQTYERSDSGDMEYSLSVEAPAPSQAHQISFTAPYSRYEEADVAGVGDTALNYRYQLVANDSVAIAPRLSLLVPTGDDEKGLGTGKVGYQTNWAVSARANAALVVHGNVGATVVPDVEPAPGAEKVTLYATNAALSVIWLATDDFNVLVEFVTEQTENSSTATVNPGVRYAVNFEKSQLVLGLSAPTPALYSSGKPSAFGYVSYEPTLW